MGIPLIANERVMRARHYSSKILIKVCTNRHWVYYKDLQEPSICDIKSVSLQCL